MRMMRSVLDRAGVKGLEDLQNLDLPALREIRGIGDAKVEKCARLSKWAQQIEANASATEIVQWLKDTPEGVWRLYVWRGEGKTHQNIADRLGHSRENTRQMLVDSSSVLYRLLGSFDHAEDLASQDWGEDTQAVAALLDGWGQEKISALFYVREPGGLPFLVSAATTTSAAEKAAPAPLKDRTKVYTYMVRLVGADADKEVKEVVVVYPEEPRCHVSTSHTWEELEGHGSDVVQRCVSCLLKVAKQPRRLADSDRVIDFISYDLSACL